MATVQFVISKSGDVSSEVSGAKGMDCEELTRAFEEALGTKTDVKYKPDYFVEIEGINQEVHES